MAGQSRCCWNTWEGNLNQSWSQEVAWSRGQSSISLLINRPWCHVSCKSIAFQIPSRVFSLLIQCWRHAFEIWFGNIANTPGHLSQWATTTEPECPRACDLIKRSTGLKTNVLQLQSSPCLLQIEKSWASDLVQPKKKNSPRETSVASGEAGHDKGWNQSGSDFMQVMEREATACFHEELGT